MAYREEKLNNHIRELAADFLSRESNGQSLLTVTSVKTFDNGKRATVFFTVLPESYTKPALDFAKRKRADFRQFVKEKSLIGLIPFFDFEIDEGEKNRQRIEELLHEDERRADGQGDGGKLE